MEVEQGPPPAILIAIGDDTLRETLEASLRTEGYRTITAADGETALHVAQQHPLLLVLLDLALPQRDGLEMCRLLRTNQETAYTPILMIATHDDETETIVGLEVGADDYVTYPFQWKLLRARIRALLRRSRYMQSRAIASEGTHNEETYDKAPGHVLVTGDLRINLAGREVIYRDQPIELSARLFDLLVYLVRHRGVVVARKDLMEQVHIDVLKGDELAFPLRLSHVLLYTEAEAAKARRRFHETTCAFHLYPQLSALTNGGGLAETSGWGSV